MPSYDVIVIGGAVRDYTFYTDQGKIFLTPQNLTAQKMLAFEYGAKIRSSEAYVSAGGGAANVSVALSRLGFRTAIICRVGSDAMGSDLLKQLKKERIHIRYAQTDIKHLTAFSFIVVANRKDRDRTIFNYVGCGELLTVESQKFSRLRTRWMYLAPLSGDRWLTNTKAIFSLAAKRKVSVLWNPGSRQLSAGRRALATLLKQTDILILNKDEAIELVLSGITLGRKDPSYLNRPLYLLHLLHEWGPSMIVITDGSKGAWVYDGKLVYRQHIKKTKVVDRTGVGDCFGASFLAGYINEKQNIQAALAWAMNNCASVIRRVGAQQGLLTRLELMKKLKR